MSDDFAEELKTRGNEAFSAKRYEDAIVLYEKASEANPQSFVYHNNRAAAYHELRQYDQAIAAAQAALAVRENAKSHARIASALWAQRKFADARRAYERALSLEPGNAAVRESLQRLEEMQQQSSSSSSSSSSAAHGGGGAAATATAHGSRRGDGPPFAPTALQRLGGEFVTPALPLPQLELLALLLDVSVAVAGVAAFASSLLMTSRTAMLWRTLLMLTMLQQLPTMYACGLLQPSLAALQRWPSQLSSALFTLCGFALLTSVRITGFMCAFIPLYAALGVLNRRATLRRTLPAALYDALAPYLDRFELRKQQALLLAASFESMLLFMIMFSGGAIFTLVYIQYVKNRYCTDGYVHLAFRALRANATRLTTVSWMPQVVDHYAQRFFDMLHMLAMRGA